MAEDGDRLRGRVRSFRGTWGFITSDEWEGDLFVGLKGNPHLRSLNPDDEVEFTVRTKSDSRAEAIDVAVCGAEDQPEADQPEAVESTSGVVSSFKGQWGFITSDAFEGDLFVGLRSNPHLPGLRQGDHVDFEIVTNASGKQEAVNVRVNGEHPAPPGPGAAEPRPRRPAAPAGPAERASVPELVGETLRGRIKSFRDQWGFVNSDTFSGDLFLHARSSPDLGPTFPGDPVEFEVAEDRKEPGNYNAVNARVLKAAEPSELIGELVTGWVKSFKGSWGLLNSQRFEGDVFVGRNSNPQLGDLRSGDFVEFVVECDSDSKKGNGARAIQVRPIQSAAGPPVPARADPRFSAAPEAAKPTAKPTAAPVIRAGLPKRTAAQQPGAAELTGHSCRGAVRSFRGDWGFLVSDEFEGDLFVHAGSNPELPLLQPGDAVCFDIVTGQNGKPHAVNVQVAPCELADLVGRACSGRVRSFSGDWGFITSGKFVGDIFVGLRTNPHLTVPPRTGDEVEFMVQQSSSTRKGGNGFEAACVRVVNASAVGVPAAAAGHREAGGAAAMRGPGAGAGAGKGAPPRPGPGAGKGAIGRERPSPGLAGGAPSARSRSPRWSAGKPAPTARKPIGAKPKNPEDLAGPGILLTGWIRSFRGEWGFINSDAFVGDLFMGLKHNKHLQRSPSANERVQFRVELQSGGKPEAVDVRPEAALPGL